MRAVLASAALGLILSWAPCVLAQGEVDDATKNAARELAQRATEAFKAERYDEAQDLFHRAYDLVPAPTLALREGRALEKLGRLVEAVEAYVRAVRTEVAADAPKAFHQALEDARDELEALRPRLPQLTIVVEGAAPDDPVTLTLDGKPVKKALVGVASPADPGERTLVARTERGAEATVTFTLAEREVKRVVLALPKAPERPSTAASTQPDDTTHDATERSQTQRYIGYGALGVGALGLGTGIVTGILAGQRYSSAEEACPGRVCEEGTSGAADLESFRSLRTLSTVGYIVGGVGAAAGVTLLLTAPTARDERGASVSAFIGVGTVGVKGAF
jgi:tetratricopeptide (TPR) repeat protein